MASPAVLSVNLADVRTLQVNGRTVRTGIHKLPADGRVEVTREGLAGDAQMDRRVHGGADQAVYAYAREDIDWWEAQLGRALPDGAFGENLTLRGVDASGATIGERWRVGTALLEVTAPRMPCGKLAARMEDRGFARRFSAAGRPGAYLRVLEEGVLGAGDPVELLARPDHGVTVAFAARAIRGERELLPRLLQAPQLPEKVRVWAERRVAAPGG